MTAIIRAASAHDFLALVPTLAGFRPEHSLLCVVFVGNRTVGVLRHDLPATAEDDDRLVAAVIGTICRIPDVDAIVPIVYTDERFADAGRMPRRDLLELVADRAGHAGFTVRDALCQAADGWCSLLDPDAPATGQPLAILEASAVLREVPEEERLAAVSGAAALPPVDAVRAAAIAAAIAEFRGLPSLEAAVAGLAGDADPVELVESLIARPRRRPVDARRAAWLLHLASRPALRDAMMLQIAFGRMMGELAHDRSGRGDAAGEAAVAREGCGTLHDGAWSGAEPDDALDDVLARLIIGRSMLRPDPARVERGLSVLRESIAHAPEDVRPGSLCIAGWLAWSIGRGSVAGAFLDAALEIEPDHSMANLLEQHIGSGALPEWVFLRPGSEDEHHGAVSGL
ncbi:DUF4192 family protein [Agromyces sp. Leaf222]|uniref:DUF4192 family protein n=1 Tax=Agromyces sp. Leaf222 TaxID=1735688 RepID=UPI0006FA77A8|nr:DUF4192 family protein [Agromyces sp. Leaf222]KQM84024.1 hypothetical protein ASE68_13100 [Agromyces sp. Leaf222]